MAPFADGTPRFVDAWEWRGIPARRIPARSRSTRRKSPGEPELHCDFIFVSDNLSPRIASVRVDRDTQAADHQPVILTLR